MANENYLNQKPVYVTSNKSEAETQKPVLVVVKGGIGSQIIRLGFDPAGETPTDALVRAFVQGEGYDKEKWGNIYVLITTGTSKGKVWSYLVNTDKWVESGTDTVNPFTDAAMGVILGKEQDGYVYHVDGEDAGTGKVHGFDKKLDKIDAASVVYATDASKNPTSVGYDINATSKTLVQRDPNGRIYTGSATSASHAVNLTQLNTELDKKVDKVAGKGLSTNDLTDELKAQYDLAYTQHHTHTNKTVLDNTTAAFTADQRDKLAGVEAGAQVNKIETIKVNGTATTITDKAVNIDLSSYATAAALELEHQGRLSGEVTLQNQINERAKSSELEGHVQFLQEEIDEEAETRAAKDTALETAINAKSTVSGTASGDNWADITINGVKKNIPVGGSGEPSAYIKSISKATNSVTWTNKDNTTDTFNVDFSAYRTSAQQDIIDNALTTELATKASKTYVDDELAKKQNIISDTNKLSYNLLKDTPKIPAKTSELTNDSGFLTSHQSLADYRKSADQDVIDTTLQTNIDAKSTVAVSATGTATDTVQYITVDGVEKKLAGGSGSVEIDDASIVKDADGKLKVSYGGKYKQVEKSYYVEEQETQVDPTFKNTLKVENFDPTKGLVAGNDYTYEVWFGGQHYTETLNAYTDDSITIMSDTGTQTTSGVVIAVTIEGVNMLMGSMTYPGTGDVLARVIFDSKEAAAAVAGSTVSIYSGGAEEVEAINGKVIPIDDDTIKLNAEGKLTAVGGGSSVEIDGVSIIKDPTTQKLKTAIGGGTSGGTSQTLLSGIQIDEVVSPTNVRISSKGAAEVSGFTIGDTVSGVFSMKGVDYDFNTAVTESAESENTFEVLMATISAENFKLTCSNKGGTNELHIISETTDLEKAVDMNVTASVGGSSIQYIDNQYLNIDSETLEVTTEGKLKVKGGTGGGYEPDGSSIIKTDDDKLAVSYGGKYIETSQSLMIGIHDTGAGVSENIRYVESVDTPEVSTFESGQIISGNIEIEGVGTTTFRNSAATIIITNLGTGDPFEFLGVKVFGDSEEYGNIYLGLHEGQFILAADKGNASTLCTLINSFSADVIEKSSEVIKADVLPINDDDFNIDDGVLNLADLKGKYVERKNLVGSKQVYGIDPVGGYKLYEINDKYATTHEVELFISGNYKDIIGNIENGYIDSDYIENDKSAVIKIIPAENFKVPAAKEDITVTNATIDSYDSTTGQLTISNATDEVSISATCIE